MPEFAKIVARLLKAGVNGVDGARREPLPGNSLKLTGKL